MQSIGVRARRFMLLPVLAVLALPFAHSQEVGTLTLLKDSPLHVIRGISVLAGIEGMRLRAGDILQTGPAATAQTQLELSCGAIIELGPSSQLFLFSHSATATEMILLSGWLKGETTSCSYRYASPLLTATTKSGRLLLHATGNAAEVFVEQGAVSVSSGNSAAIASSGGKTFFTHRTGKALIIADRPTQEFIATMPVCFRDLLPSRLPRFTGVKPTVPKNDHYVTYAEIESWLTSNWGKSLVERFKPRLEDRAFRQAIEAHLAAVPEWETALNPP
jgi:hypothetical protein